MKKEDNRQRPYGSFPIIDSNERVEGSDIVEYLETKVTEQTAQATRYRHKVRLKDGRVVTIKDIEIEGLG